MDKRLTISPLMRDVLDYLGSLEQPFVVIRGRQYGWSNVEVDGIPIRNSTWTALQMRDLIRPAVNGNWYEVTSLGRAALGIQTDSKYIAEMIEARQYGSDPERAHGEADDIMVRYVRQNCPELADAYEAIKKWYA